MFIKKKDLMCVCEEVPVFFFFLFFNTIFVSSHMYPENPEETQVIVDSMNMGYISDTARNRAHNLFRPKREPIPLGHSDGTIRNCMVNCYMHEPPFFREVLIIWRSIYRKFLFFQIISETEIRSPWGYTRLAA